MNYNRNSLENLKDLYTSVHTTKKDQFLSEGVEVEEGYKEIDRDKENRMYRRAGNLARQSLSSKGKKKYEAAKKSANIVGAITRQKENERFAKMADEKARDNYRENFYDVVCDYIISEGFASDTDGANQVILKLDDELMLDIYEAKMTAAHKEKEGKLKDKYDDSEMKQNMIKQYGKEEGEKIYFATIRKQAMEEVEIDEAVYGGGKKKEEPKDTRKVVTRADKLGNTKAYQNYKGGDPRYKAADHLKEKVEQLHERPYQVMGSPDGKKEKKIGKPVKSRKYADARAAELADTHKKTGGKYRSQYVEGVEQIDEATPLFYKLQAKRKQGSSTARAQLKTDASLEDQKSKKMRQQQARQRQEREPEDKYGHPSLSAAERNPSMR